jgi:hypothetical protein
MPFLIRCLTWALECAFVKGMHFSTKNAHLLNSIRVKCLALTNALAYNGAV